MGPESRILLAFPPHPPITKKKPLKYLLLGHRLARKPFSLHQLLQGEPSGMRKLALLSLPFLLAAVPALGQQSLSPHPGFDNQTGRAQNASRMSGLHTDSSQVHQMDTNAANSMGAN